MALTLVRALGLGLILTLFTGCVGIYGPDTPHPVVVVPYYPPPVYYYYPAYPCCWAPYYGWHHGGGWHR